MNETVNDINSKVFDLWKAYFPGDANTLCPLIYPALKTKCLLFVGLNPSFTEGWQRMIQRAAPEGIDTRTFFLWQRREQFDFTVAQKLERYSKDNYNIFFGKLSTLANDVGLEWEHVDLFFYRETMQHSLKPIVGIEGNETALNEFGRNQLALSKVLIAISKPKIIVVANALASRIFLKEYKPRFDNDNGYYLTNLNGDVVPTFPCSMLTGGRALDIFSFERLKWHTLKTIRRRPTER